MGIPWEAKGMPVEFLTLSDEKGARLRATVIEFGPVLLSRILELNDTQGGVVSLAFKYCDGKGIPLLDLKDFKKVLQYLSNEGKEEIKDTYGAISTTSVSTIMRKIIEIEQQGADRFFGEESFSAGRDQQKSHGTADRTDPGVGTGQGIIWNIRGKTTAVI